MTALFQVLAACIAGLLLGWVYFEALWATVRRLPRQRRPAMWMALSFLGRLATALAVFVLLARWGNWATLVAALAGFLIARAVLVHRVRTRAI